MEGIEKLKYPIGRFEAPSHIGPEDVLGWIEDLSSLPAQLRLETAALTDSQLDTPYRPGGWTLRQVVHHLADSHLNAYVRFKLALTEDFPTIKPYDENQWAAQPEARTAGLAPSLLLLEGLHLRWALMLRSMGSADWQKGFFHPDHGKNILLGETLAHYAWHGRHHLGHIKSLKKQMAWL